MKILFTCFLLWGFFSFSSAQIINSTEWKSDAHVKVYVTEWKSDADLIVYKTKWKSDAKKNEGIWFFTEWKSDADKKIFFTDWKSEADVIIYFSEYKSDAGWKNAAKKHWFY
jgi:hypothetical protein